MTEFIIFLFLGLFLLDWALETGLAGLNLAHTLAGSDTPPAPLRGAMDEQTVRKSRAYTVARLRFGLLRGVAGAGYLLLLLFSGLLPWLETLLRSWQFTGPHLFVSYLALLALLSALLGLPFALYSTFRIEAAFGFNRMGLGLWLLDRMKGLLLAGLLGVPFLYGVYLFMESSGRWWWLWLFLFIALVQMVLVWLYPAFIAPLFNKFTPLPEGEPRRRMEEMARRARFRMAGIFTMDASRRSGHSNAYFTGLLRPRIVLFDTMLDEMSMEESLSVLAHEIGHYREHHIHKGLALNLAGTLFMLWVLNLLVDWPPLFEAFGFAGPSHHAALTLVLAMGGPFTFYLEPLLAWISRRHEYQADAFSLALLGMPGALKSALIRLNGQNLANLRPHPWYAAYHYSHPTLLQRLAAIDRLAAQGQARRVQA
ncbi:MAG: M48 family metallopeptidase [SAR324 cluster bacterium]|nr:M48 family metallopeptidase [SAR324 cluster bacterium]